MNALLHIVNNAIYPMNYSIDVEELFNGPDLEKYGEMFPLHNPDDYCRKVF